MISFDNFSPREGPPIYQQIILHIKRGAAAGTVVHGDELPSRRTLSALLGVNPNTVQKAYRLLEEEGLIQSHAGTKSYMVLSPERVEALRSELLAQDIRETVSGLKQLGLSREEALALIQTYWE